MRIRLSVGALGMRLACGCALSGDVESSGDVPVHSKSVHEDEEEDCSVTETGSCSVVWAIVGFGTAIHHASRIPTRLGLIAGDIQRSLG